MKTIPMKKTNPATIEDTSRATLQATPDGVRAFREARYGLSVHWGLYSLLSGELWTGESVLSLPWEKARDYFMISGDTADRREHMNQTLLFEKGKQE